MRLHILHELTCACVEKEEAAKLAEKHVGKIRKEEASKEQQQSPISPGASKKLSEMDKKAEQHDQNTKK